jgi:hypothetical protein
LPAVITPAPPLPASATETELRMAATLDDRRGQTLSHIKSGRFAGIENAQTP